MHRVSRYRNSINSDSAAARVMQKVVPLPLPPCLQPFPPQLGPRLPAAPKSDAQVCLAKTPPTPRGWGRPASHRGLSGCSAPSGRGRRGVPASALQARSSSQEHRHYYRASLSTAVFLVRSLCATIIKCFATKIAA